MKKLFLLVLLTNTICSFTQEPLLGAEKNELPQIIPTSPTVGSLMRFEEVPVDYYSGKPSIGIPIFTKSLSGGVQIPIGLKYNTMGVRVDERSGWTGTGWSLEGEAVISRTVRGIADELDQKNIAHHAPDHGKYSIGIYHNGYFEMPWKDASGNIDYTANNENYNIQEFLFNTSGNGTSTYDGDYDHELDLYQLSLFGKFARFVIVKESGELIPKMMSNDSSLKIEVTHNNYFEIEYFLITDTNGNKYSFYVTEISEANGFSAIVAQNPEYNNISANYSKYVSSWKIGSIKTSNETLLAEFSYQDVYEEFDTPRSTTEALYNRTIFPLTYVGSPPFERFTGTKPDLDRWEEGVAYNNRILKPKKTHSYSKLKIASKKLETISFHDGTEIKFLIDPTENHPEYVNSGSVLKEVIIKESSVTNFKTFKFNYSNKYKSRMFLEEVVEVYDNNNELKYLLDYYEPDITNNVDDNLKDVWGYYRGKPETIHIYDLTKSANLETIKTGVLKSISYPTGGIKTFDFESNTFSHRGSKWFSDIEFALYNPDNWDKASVTKDFDNVNSNGIYSDEFIKFMIDYEHEVFYRPHVIGGNIGDIENSRIRIEKTDAFGQVIDQVAQLKLDDNEELVLLSPGKYKMSLISLSTPDSSNPPVLVNVDLFYKDFKSSLSKFIYGGGLRIKNIDFTDPMNLNTIESTSFNYDVVENSSPSSINNSLSSGVIDGFLTNVKEYEFYDDYVLGVDGGGVSQTIYFDLKEYINETYVSLSKNNFVGYGKVTVKKEMNGKTVFEYTTPADFPTYGENYGYPFFPTTDKAHLHGNLTKQVVFNNDNKILEETKFDYNIVETPVTESLFTYDEKCYYSQYYSRYQDYLNHFPTSGNSIFGENPGETYSNCSLGTAPLHVPVYYYFYNNIYGRSLLNKKTSRKYFNVSSTAPSMVESQNEYVYNDNHLPTLTKTTVNGTDEYLVENKYVNSSSLTSQELSSFETGVITKMENLNMIATPVIVKSSKNSNLLSTKVNHYHDFDSNLLLPIKVQSSKSSNPLEDKLLFHRYDDYGNLLEVSKKDGTRVSYLWGYNHTKPTAKIEGASYEEIAVALGISVTDLVNPSGTFVLINNLREILPKAMVTTYAYKPLVGITFMTDPRGYTTRYEYDEFNRLKFVKDAEGNILSENQYNYRTQN